MARARSRRRRFTAKARRAALRNLSKARSKRRRGGRRRSRSAAPRRRHRRSRSRARSSGRRRRRHYARNPGRRRRRHYRRNPALSMGGFLPSFGQGTQLVKTGAVAALGWIGTNGVMMLLDKIGVGTLKARITDPKIMAAANLVERTLAAFIASKLLSRVVKGESNASALRIGAAANVGLHTAADVVSAFGVALPAWGAPLLLGYSGGGLGGYVTQATLARRVTPGMRGFVTAGSAFRNNSGTMLNAAYRSAFPTPSY